MKLPWWLSIFRWLAIDVYRFIKGPRKVHLYGVYMYNGKNGAGKTIGLTEKLIRLRKKYGDKIYICTNYGFELEDFPLTHWKQLLQKYDKSIVFAYDEVQNDFNSRDYKNFPFELIRVLTQNRKGNGIQILMSAPKFNEVDKSIRDLVFRVCQCRKAWFGRVTKVRDYDIEDYEMYINEIDVVKKRKIPCRKYQFIQTDEIRNAYDTLAYINSAKDKEYVSSSEKLASILGDLI